MNFANKKNIVIIILVAIIVLQGLFLFKSRRERQPAAKPPKEAIVKVAPEKKPPAVPVAGKIGIIIDDWGYNDSHCRYLESISEPLTISVLPNLPHSQDASQCARQRQKEVMLHLPLEPHKIYETYPDDYVIMTNMSSQKAVDIFTRALASVPGAKGINNHMGSKATENEKLMRELFAEMKKNNFYFIDSLVTNASVCKKLTAEYAIPFAARDIFLDNENNRDYIRGQIQKLADLARKRGYAIGIGHDRALTLSVLAEEMTRLKNEGFVFLTISELLESHEDTGH